MDEFVLSVTQLNNYVEDKLYSDTLLSDLYLKGELTGVNLKYSNAFFSMKDEGALVECIITDVSLIENLAELKDGETIVARGSASLYKKSGRYRFVVRSFQVAGQGELYRNFLELKEKLSKAGIFDPEHKKRLPPYPVHVGVVTSANGAALRDIMNIAARRNNTVKLSVYGARVQGEGASAEIAHGIRVLNVKGGIDVIIVARGGGSAEDLSVFNTEEIVMAVYHSKLPVISAVGHETDFTLCDFAADVRAPTPSAAAELCIPDKKEILAGIHTFLQKISHLTAIKVDERAYALRVAATTISSLGIRANIDTRTKEIAFNRQRIYDILIKKIEYLKNAASEHSNSIALLNPEDAFKRGYVLVQYQGKPLTSVQKVQKGDELSIRFADGLLTAQVLEKRARDEVGK
jgi:exodeoxyribonuclease VII large subunit